jgi:hypothetical protein
MIGSFSGCFARYSTIRISLYEGEIMAVVQQLIVHIGLL